MQISLPRFEHELDLSINEERWVNEWLINGGNAEAANEKIFGYSRNNNKWTNSGHFFKRPRIQKAIKAVQASMRQRHQIDRDTVVQHLADMACYDIDQILLDHDGQTLVLKPLGELTRAQARAIKKISQRPDGTLVRSVALDENGVIQETRSDYPVMSNALDALNFLGISREFWRNAKLYAPTPRDQKTYRRYAAKSYRTYRIKRARVKDLLARRGVDYDAVHSPKTGDKKIMPREINAR